MKKLRIQKLSLLLISLIVLSLLVVGCGEGKSEDTDSSEVGSGDLIDTEDEFKEMSSDPDKFKGDSVEFTAKVFLEPEIDSGRTYFQCYAYNNENLNTIVAFDEKIDLKDEDIVIIKGTVEGEMEGENLMGGKLSLVGINADSIEATDYASAFAPAIKTVEIDEEIDQHGYLMKINKVEFAEDETRVYLTITNDTDNNISFYSFNAKAVQGSSQLKEEDMYERGYPEMESEILPGVIEEGMIVFSEADPDESLKIHLEGMSDDYELEFEPFIFEVK